MKPAAKKSPGRPVLSDEDRRDQTIRVRATAAEAAKFEAVGAAEWFRAALKRARPKP